MHWPKRRLLLPLPFEPLSGYVAHPFRNVALEGHVTPFPLLPLLADGHKQEYNRKASKWKAFLGNNQPGNGGA